MVRLEDFAAGFDGDGVKITVVMPPDAVLEVDARTYVIWNYRYAVADFGAGGAGGGVALAVLFGEFGDFGVGVFEDVAVAVGGDLDQEVSQALEKSGKSGPGADMMQEMKIDAGSRFGLWMTIGGLLGVAVLTGMALKEKDDFPSARAMPGGPPAPAGGYPPPPGGGYPPA